MSKASWIACYYWSPEFIGSGGAGGHSEGPVILEFTHAPRRAPVVDTCTLTWDMGGFIYMRSLPWALHRASAWSWGQSMLAGGAAALLVRAASAAFVTVGPVLLFGGGVVVLGGPSCCLWSQWPRVMKPQSSCCSSCMIPPLCGRSLTHSP